MKNHYTISDDGLIATIWLKRRNGDIINCLVDSADLPKLLAFKARWYAAWHPHTRSSYALCNVIKDQKNTTIRMHRFLMDAPDGLEVDHRDHDTLDNRRFNLRIATRSINGMNRKGAAIHSKTGHRGIIPTYGKFRLTVTIDGKRTYIGMFSTIDEAIVVRNQYPGYEKPNKHDV